MSIKDPDRWIAMAKRAGEAIKPPKADADPHAVIVWRWVVVVGLVFNTTVLAMQCLLVWGMLPVVFTGFASASTIKRTDEKLEATRSDIVLYRVELLEWRIFDLRLAQCAAIKRKDNSRLYYTYQIDGLTKKYRALTQVILALPPCEELQ